jgi:L-ribulokinase
MNDQARYVLGFDFGTESGRAVLFDVADGRLVDSAIHPYSNGVIDERLPESGRTLGPDWALQDPDDYQAVLRDAGRRVVEGSGVDPAQIIGVGIDFTACTMLPTTADGTPLCTLPRWRDEPNAWVKLWKHHAAQSYADQINAAAEASRPDLLARHGGRYSSEWFWSKVLQTVNEAPEVHAAAERYIEACDWVVWQLTGLERRAACVAGYKALWDPELGFPDEFLAGLHPGLAGIVDSRMQRDLRPLGERAGGLTDEWAEALGLAPDTAVAIATLDAHTSVPATGVTEPGRMVMIMGTSICHLVIGEERREVEGMCGVIQGGITPSTWGYEAGQSCVGDHFAWFVASQAPAEDVAAAQARGVSVNQVLEERAARIGPGESGLVALDWWNGNRSVLVDADLTGLLLGMTLRTRPEEMYRALMEATAYGTRTIIEAFERQGVPVTQVVACGGLPDESPLLMQIFSDVTGREIWVAQSPQTPALGAAMHAAVAAGSERGGYPSIEDAAARMGHLRDVPYRPSPERSRVYDQLYSEYQVLHDYLGRGGNDVMKRLKALRSERLAARVEGGSGA